MAVFAVEFSHGLSLPFMELSVSKLERNTGRSERKQREDAERLEDKQRGS